MSDPPAPQRDVWIGCPIRKLPERGARRLTRAEAERRVAAREGEVYSCPQAGYWAPAAVPEEKPGDV